MSEYQYKSPLEGSYDDGYEQKNSHRFLPYSRRDCGEGKGNKSETQSPLKPPGTSSPQLRQTTMKTKTYHNRRQNEPGPSTQPSYSDRFRQQSSYPRELTDKFGALECLLCAVKVQSPIQAKMHYSGQKHLKCVRRFLLEWSIKRGLPMPKVEGPTISSSISALEDYCEVCDVRMASINDKILHYSGENHQKNERDPGNARKKKKAYETVEITSRFGIGSDFKKDKCEPIEKPVENIKAFVCELCDVKTCTTEQLKIHLGGKKHKDRLEKKDRMVPYAVNPSVSILASVAKDQTRDIIDYSMHRTPSGHYYCGVCDLTLNSELQFIEHIENKKHKKNFTGKKSHK